MQKLITVSTGEFELITSGIIPTYSKDSYKIKIKNFEFILNFKKMDNEGYKYNIIDKNKGIVEIEFFYSSENFSSLGTSEPISLATIGGVEIFLSLFFITGYGSSQLLTFYSIFKKEVVTDDK